MKYTDRELEDMGDRAIERIEANAGTRTGRIPSAYVEVASGK
jgi:hypothetical protein